LLRDPCHGIFPFFRRFRDSGPMHKYLVHFELIST
jgi:hypothetical protein